MKQMQTCSICKKTVVDIRCWVNCPKVKEPICMSHCFDKCKYREEDHCSYTARMQRKTKKKNSLKR